MKTIKRNFLTFGLGTVGRDMLYTMISMYLIYYLTDVLSLSTKTILSVTIVMVIARVFDAVNDPFMGLIVDNTKTKFGKFKPWIVIGGLASGVFTILLFTDFSLTGSKFVLVFSIIYILWGIAYTANDISYWSMLPSISLIQKDREKIGAFARLCANIGMFTIVAGIVPITNGLSLLVGSMEAAYRVLAIIVVVLMWLGLLVTIFGVKEKEDLFKPAEKTKLSELVWVIFKNDQLLWISISMGLFMIAYITTTSFGLYYFKYSFGDESMYSIFALVLGLSQILALSSFQFFSNKFSRGQLFNGAFSSVVIGYVIFFFASANLVIIGLAGVFMFFGQAFIQLLMLMFLADTVEYGHYKLGKRNESITFSLQPFINKIGGAAASGIVGITVIIAGIANASSPSDVSASGLLIMKISMLIIPMLLIVISFFIYKNKYIIDSKYYNHILYELKKRGDIN